MPALFRDHMVLQQEMPLPIWGRAKAGERVKVELAEQTQTTIADVDGHWEVEFQPLAPRNDSIEMKISGENEVILRDILVGDVWLCGGQSNMAWPLLQSHGAEEALREANQPAIRMFQMEQDLSFRPQDDCRGDWKVCTPESAAGFSAVAHTFAKQLQAKLNRPIGLVGVYWGGTQVEAWTSRDGLAREPSLANLVQTFDNRRTRLQELRAKYLDETLPAWEQAEARRQQQATEAEASWKNAVAAAKLESRPAPPKPVVPAAAPHPYLSDPITPHQPVVLNYGMIKPLKKMALRGVIWYQGESNDQLASKYGTLLPALIADWRAQFAQPELPFLYVQIANYRERAVGPSHHPWCLVREGQLHTLSVPKTGMISAIDLGETYDIHPKNKRVVGERLALAARAAAYGEDVRWSGPVYAGASAEVGGRMRVSFKHANGGLLAALPRPQPDFAPPLPTDRLVGFTVAGEDQRFHVAEAAIEGETVVVWSKDVPAPVAVRYGWASNPAVSLYNKAGFPASPFRTDSWNFSK